MICPKCGRKLQISKKDPNYALCSQCRKKYKINSAGGSQPHPNQKPSDTEKHTQTGYFTDDQYDDGQPHTRKKKYANVPPSKVRSTREADMRHGYDELLSIEDDKPGIGSNILTAVIILLVVAVIGAGVYFVYNKMSKNKSSTDTPKTTQTTDNDKTSSDVVTKDLPDGEYTDMGDGTFSISTDYGNSSDGSTPVFIITRGDTEAQLNFTAAGISGNNLTYIYIDGYLTTKAQISDTQSTLSLSGSALDLGVHKIEIVQYENEIPTSTMITYKTCSYELQIQDPPAEETPAA